MFCNNNIYFSLMDISQSLTSTNIIINTLQKIIYVTGFTTLFFMIRNLKELQHQKQETLTARQLATESQLQLLQEQVNPHFLFNSLNSLRSLILIDTSKARDMVTSISEFLRVALTSSHSSKRLVSEELKVLNDYLNIQKIRWEDDLIVVYDLASNVSNLKIPTLMLQPLVENAIKHGMKDGKVLTIEVNIQKNRDKLIILIKNNGSLKINVNHSGGNKNIIKRLDLIYGNAAHFSLYENEGKVHSKIIIKI